MMYNCTNAAAMLLIHVTTYDLCLHFECLFPLYDCSLLHYSALLSTGLEAFLMMVSVVNCVFFYPLNPPFVVFGLAADVVECIQKWFWIAANKLISGST